MGMPRGRSMLLHLDAGAARGRDSGEERQAAVAQVELVADLLGYLERGGALVGLLLKALQSEKKAGHVGDSQSRGLRKWQSGKRLLQDALRRASSPQATCRMPAYNLTATRAARPAATQQLGVHTSCLNTRLALISQEHQSFKLHFSNNTHTTAGTHPEHHAVAAAGLNVVGGLPDLV